MGQTVQCGANIVLSYSAFAQSVSLSATSVGATSYRWTLIGLPLNSFANVGANGDFFNGVALIQNPSFNTEGTIQGTYVFECIATGSGNSEPLIDKAKAQQCVTVKTQYLELVLPGDYQYDWSTYYRSCFVALEAALDVKVQASKLTSFAALNASMTDGSVFDQSADSRTPITHSIAGTRHSPSHLASLNSLFTDGTILDDHSASRPPLGPARGDLSGTFPSPTVTGILGVSIQGAGATTEQALIYTGSSYTPQNLINAMSGLLDTSNSSGYSNNAWRVKLDESGLECVTWGSIKQNWPRFRSDDVVSPTLIFAEAEPGRSSTFQLILSDNLMYTATGPLILNYDTTGLLGRDAADSKASGLWNIFAVPSGTPRQFSIICSKGAPLSGPTSKGTTYPIWKYLWSFSANNAVHLKPFCQRGKWFKPRDPTDMWWNVFYMYAANLWAGWKRFNGESWYSGYNSSDMRLKIPCTVCDICEFGIVIPGTIYNEGDVAVMIMGGDPPTYTPQAWWQYAQIALSQYGTGYEQAKLARCRVPLVNGMAAAYMPIQYNAMSFSITAYRNPMWGDTL